MKSIKLIFLALILAGYWLNAGSALAVDEPEDIVNYAYSSWIGSGFYKINDRTVYLLRAPFSYTLREADEEKWGL
jgi:hypothetical protein